jgi:peptidoglycan hydrolase-like protein with peptidoglycan-binding domain
MGISTEQRAWLKGLGDMVGDAPVVDEDEGDVEREDRADKGRARAKTRGVPRQALADLPVLAETDDEKGGDEDDEQGSETGSSEKGVEGQRFGFGPEDILPVIPGLIDEATQRRATCALHNNTQQVLKLDTASLEDTDDESGKSPGIVHGKYVQFPPSQVVAGDQSQRFVAENNKFLVFSTSGAEGVLRYTLDAQGTAWIVHFNNPFGATGDKNSAAARLEGPNAAQFETPKPGMSGKSDVKYLFILNSKGGAGPGPGPTPGPNMPSSCLITVTNNTKVPLIFLDAKHERGNFLTPVPNTVAAGASVTIASVETPNAKEQGCKGFIFWRVGSATGDAFWTIFWDNPEGEKNTSTADFIPQPGATPETAFAITDQIGQGDENVPAQFTISGGGGTGPVPIIPPEVEPPFEPPVESKQPTLRITDKNEDFWVEYAQRALNQHLKINLKVDGDFGNATHAAVFKFQALKGLQRDGTIGNETWAALREGVPEPVGTDGRKPHTFVEQGVEARWARESRNNNFYTAANDTLMLQIISVGDTALDPKTEATVRITAPGGAQKVKKIPIGPADAAGGQPSHFLSVTGLRAMFPAVPPSTDITQFRVEAYLPQELGGDLYDAPVRDR